MRRIWLSSKIFFPLVGAVLPLYLLVSFSSVVCSFHHLEETRFRVGHHHHSSQKSDHDQAKGSGLDFCKYAQSISPVIHTAPAKRSVSFEPVAQVFLDQPSILSEEKVAEILPRAPPSLIKL